MGNFNKGGRNDRGSGGRGFGGGGGGRGYGGGGRGYGGGGGGRGYGGGGRSDGGRPTMHKVTCHDCGNQCEVPFRPTTDKPLYCSDCFKNHDDKPRDDRGRGHHDRNDRRSDQRFENKRPYQDNKKDTEDYKMQFQQINRKLDRILKVLIPNNPETAQSAASEKPEKAPKKEIDTKAVKDALDELEDKISEPQKKAVKKTTKKTTAKKTTVKKKASTKKVGTKKTTTKKASAKKTAAKKK